MKQTVLLLSCEHAVNKIPREFKHLFPGTLSSYQARRAMDEGALSISHAIQKTLACELTQTNVTRLLIDCNRSLSRERCFSKYTKSLSPDEKQKIVSQHYHPFRAQTQQIIEQYIRQERQVLHLSIHTFHPMFRGFTRNASIGLMYNSKRHGEKEVARIWHGLLMQETPSYRIRYNYPFPGNSDSFVKTLRNEYPESDYLGIELEINQALLRTPQALNDIKVALAHSLGELMALL